MATVNIFENFFSLLSENFDFLYLRLNGYQLILDAVLLVLFLYVLFRKPAKLEKPLTEEEIQELVDNWTPEPLIPERTPLMELDDKTPTISSTTATHVTVDGHEVLNLTRTNFLGMIGNSKVEEAATKALFKYGTGTCGPRGFYGTIDIHLELEERIRKFMDAEDYVIYSFGFSTVASVIPAFSSRGDLLIADKGVSFAIQNGMKLSRAEVMWFEHNNMDDLEKVLKKVQEKDRQTKREITRRFIIIEGIYFNYGNICPLPKIMELSKKYSFRILMDDSYGIGSTGKNGRGTCEYFAISPRDIDILTGNLASITSSVGGFCCASKSTVYHQRLNSAGYVYSASLPPLLAAASIAALDVIDESPNLLRQLEQNITIFHNLLSGLEGLTVTSAANTAVIHLRLTKSSGDRYVDEFVLQNIVDQALQAGVFFTRAKYVHSKEAFAPPPSIRAMVSAVNTKNELTEAATIIKSVTSKVMKQRTDLEKQAQKNKEAKESKGTKKANIK